MYTLDLQSAIMVHSSPTLNFQTSKGTIYCTGLVEWYEFTKQELVTLAAKGFPPNGMLFDTLDSEIRNHVTNTNLTQGKLVHWIHPRDKKTGKYRCGTVWLAFASATAAKVFADSPWNVLGKVIIYDKNNL